MRRFDERRWRLLLRACCLFTLSAQLAARESVLRDDVRLGCWSGRTRLCEAGAEGIHRFGTVRAVLERNISSG